MPEIKTSVSSRMHYKKLGAGPAVVLLHGFPENSDLWRNIWDDLSGSFTLIIPDLPGSGESALEKETTIPMMAEAVKEILDAEAISSAVIAGHSMGGYVALAFANLYPGMVQGLALVHSTPAADDEEKKKTRLRSAELIRNGGKEQFVKQMVPNLFSDAFKQSAPQAVKEQIDEALETDSDSLANFCDAMRLRSDSREMVRTARFPMQWVIGMGDNVMDYRKLLTESHQSAINFVSFYHDCGHMSMIEAPGKLAADLKSFASYSYKIHSAAI